MNHKTLQQRIFSVTPSDFDALALEIFRFQYENNSVYAEFVRLLGVDVNAIKRVDSIPFLPIEFFKSHKIIAADKKEQKIFESSGTTGDTTSRHYVANLSLYEASLLSAFKLFFGVPKHYCILGLLPSYLERNNSSLVYMVDYLIKASGNPLSGFYLNEYEKLSSTLQILEKQKQKTILLGVTFALLDFAEMFPMPLRQTIIMETGGMKGRREELPRNELHIILCKAFQVKKIYSEYGMTELLSQAYSKGDGVFQSPPWMKILVRDINDPFQLAPMEQSGAINIIDLANLDSCSFIATSDIGRCLPGEAFEVLGRMDYSDVRGCNLLVQ